VVYCFVLGMVAAYGLHRYILLYLFLKWKHKTPRATEPLPETPLVTIQLPIYNERYVVGRLLEAVTAIDHPRELLEIQVLDDSNDETVEIVSHYVTHYRQKGFNIHHLHRDKRRGFKAGALQEGLKKARGEFIAIFDADFLPPKDFLARTLPHFRDGRVGMVQTRWGHLNEDYSLLTRIQAIFLDGHFVIEHAGRNCSGRFMSFNGTAGIWRKKTIEEAGGWQADTLTEDLDLSYRAQMAGWKFVFLPDAVSPAELPVEMNAFKTQQYRWTKGAIQTARKHLLSVLKSDLPWKVKLEAMIHLTNPSAYLFMFILTLLFFPAFVLPLQYSIFASRYRVLFCDIPLFLLGTCSISAFYIHCQKQVKRGWWKTFAYLPLMMALGVGISLTNAGGVLSALFGTSGVFERTPKFGVSSRGERWYQKAYRGKKSFLPLFELFLALTFSSMILIAIEKECYFSIPFLVIFAFGYYYVGFVSIFQGRVSPVLARGKRFRQEEATLEAD